MMGLLDGLEMPQRTFPCRVRTLSEELEPTDGAKLLELVMDENWKYKPLADALRGRGIVCSQPAIKAHRTGVCSCSKI